MFKPLIVLLSICAVGYAVDHWDELSSRGEPLAGNPHGLIVYSKKSSGACVKLENELKNRHIAYERRDLDKEANSQELSEKLARVGKMGGNVAIPVAEVDGVLYQDISIDKLAKKLR